MPESELSLQELREAIDIALQTPWSACTDDFLPSESLTDFSAPVQNLLGKGKRFRGIEVGIGWLASHDSMPTAWTPAVINLATAVEIYQASALVHDDVIDNAVTRRGLPAAHVAFAAQNDHSNNWYGISSAILWGDLLFSAASSFLHRATATLPTKTAEAVRRTFDIMTAEVAYGQYLDISAEFSDLSHARPPRAEAAMEVLKHKSARYSVVYPLLLGAALGGASPAQIDSLRQISEPLGTAFQLRDDDLGIFGDPEVTGKPSGDDIRQGKRTVLLALGWQMTDDAGRNYLMRYWGAPDVTGEVIENVRRIMVGSGAFARHEALINDRVQKAQTLLDQSTFSAPAQDFLAELAQKLTKRNS